MVKSYKLADSSLIIKCRGGGASELEWATVDEYPNIIFTDTS